MRSFVALVSASCFFVACYAYAPVQAVQTTTAGTVRLTLTPSSYSQSFGSLGSQIAAVEGEVRAIDDSSVTISVTNVMRSSLEDEQFHGESVTVPKHDIAAFDRRRVDAPRSLALTGIIVGGAIWLAAALGNGLVNQVHQKGPSTGQ